MEKSVYQHIQEKTGDVITQWKICKRNGSEFPIFARDEKMLEKLSPFVSGKNISLPLPTLSPQMRMLRRLLRRNEHRLYNTTCGLTGKKTVTRIATSQDYKIYANEVRSSDGRDSSSYGVDIDRDKSIMKHIIHLAKATPYQNLIGSLSNIKNNAVYTNYTADLQDCYFVFDSNTTENACYVTKSSQGTNIFDSLSCHHTENCYECVDCEQIYNLFFSTACKDCSNSYFLQSCQGCSNCIGCVNIVGKQYHVFNEPVSKEEYNIILSKLADSNYDIHSFPEYKTIQESSIRHATTLINTENCIGENIRNAQNAFLSYDIFDAQDCRYCDTLSDASDLMDISSYGNHATLMYESSQVGRHSTRLYFSSTSGKSENLYYCIEVKKSRNCFGCVNMRDKEYCIFNKQYTKSEYEELVIKLIEKAKSENIWGEAIPTYLSPYPYNDTVAVDYFPVHTLAYPDGEKVVYDPKGVGEVFIHEPEKFVSKATLDLGGKEKIKIRRRTKETEINIPTNIEVLKNIPDIEAIDANGESPDFSGNILQKIIICSESQKPFTLVKSELEFYRKHNLPIPRKHPNIRHKERLSRRSERNLYIRSCDKCEIETLSVYPSDTKARIFCNDCYNKEIYG